MLRSASACYVRGFGNPTPVEVPCCTGICEIPGPEAGPDVMVFCTEPPATPCPCWTSASLDAAFPPGFFDEAERDGALCESPGIIAAFGAIDSCVFLGPPGQEFVLPRGGAAVITEGVCALFADTDPSNSGVCSGLPIVRNTTAEQSAACVAALTASQTFQSECP